jgi:NAD(P)H dehydrogenase (quinone)
MSYVVTAATGQLGRLVVDGLLARGVAPDDILATARDLDRLRATTPAGVRTRRLDYADPSTLTGAFAPGDRVLLVSGTDMGERVAQHRAVIDAAAAADVALLAYTSAPYADTTTLGLAAEHLATERVLVASGAPYTLLRNGWYVENYAPAVAGALAQGVLLGATRSGRISAAPRADFAEAAAAVLVGSGHEGATYELGGDSSFSLPELAAEVGRLSGRPIGHREVTPAELEQVFQAAGLPALVAAVYADVDRAIAEGALQIDSGDLSRLLGRPTTPWTAGVAGFVESAAA